MISSLNELTFLVLETAWLGPEGDVRKRCPRITVAAPGTPPILSGTHTRAKRNPYSRALQIPGQGQDLGARCSGCRRGTRRCTCAQPYCAFSYRLRRNRRSSLWLARIRRQGARTMRSLSVGERDSRWFAVLTRMEAPRGRVHRVQRGSGAQRTDGDHSAPGLKAIQRAAPDHGSLGVCQCPGDQPKDVPQREPDEGP